MNLVVDPVAKLARQRGLASDGLDRTALARAVADELGMEWMEWGGRSVADEVLARVPRSFALERTVLPVAAREGALVVAVSDPLALDVADDLAYLAGGPVQLVLAEEGDLRAAIARCYSSGVREQAAAEASSRPPIAIASQEGEATERDAPVVKLVQDIIAEGIQRRASDIHLEPLEKRFRVRYRIDGLLQEGEAPSKRLQLPVIARVKIMAGLSIAEKRVPQDGRIRSDFAGRKMDMRVSSLPTAHGESIVMRLLDQDSLRLSLPELGFLPDDQALFESQIASPDGIVLVTGPTGSGKTTTLYACLHHLNQADRKIITVEDPVEYQISGINQVPVNTAAGMTFAAALKAMLRQAPNIVMVGEIRDRETAEIAINASQTGHLVFSTLHTNDATSAVTRLLDIGAKPFLVASSLRSVLAQRLVRRICGRCRQPHTPSDRELEVLGLSAVPPGSAGCARGAGCPACQGTGYRGRVGIFELFSVSEGIRGMIYDNVTAARLRAQARAEGMRTMREDGVRKVLAGFTTIEEVVSVTAVDQV
ncbi:MAG TPA: GspE/PulE family protein [Lacunisphaera sp.]|nr:GspE/PulE family protein [Lacunisphaera sp.]